MSRNLPARRPDHRRSSKQLFRATAAQSRTELAIFEHSLEARYVAECDRLDSQAIGDVMRTALEEELSLLNWGTEEASGSQAKAELVARKVSMLSNINNRRIERRFGR